MGLKFKIYMPVRHPFEVIQSLVVRDNLEPKKACYIWLWNFMESLIFLKNRGPKFVIYDKILRDSTNYLSGIFGEELPKSLFMKINIKLNHNSTAKSLFSKNAEPFRTALGVYEEILEAKIPTNTVIDFFVKKFVFIANFHANLLREIILKLSKVTKKICYYTKRFYEYISNSPNSTISSTVTSLSIKEKILLILKSLYRRYKNC